MPVVEVVNIARTLEELKEAGFQTLGFDSEAAYEIGQCDLTGDVALVMGAEGDGLRRLVRENCDRLVRLPTAPRQPNRPNRSMRTTCAWSQQFSHESRRVGYRIMELFVRKSAL